MAGHSKWNNIKHRKGAADARKSKIFSKLAKYIMVAAKNGGGNLGENLRLRYAVEKARAESMPKDSIERAIKKGTGNLRGEDLSELVYEGIGPGGISFIIEVLTDNRNRTSGEIRHLLEKKGASLGKTNSVAWKFDRRGVLGVAKQEIAEDELYEITLEAGAENIEEEESRYDVYASLENFESVRGALQRVVEDRRGTGQKKWGEAEDERPVFTRNEVVYLPQNQISLNDLNQARQILGILQDVEDHEDVQNVHSDFDIPDQLIEKIMTE